MRASLAIAAALMATAGCASHGAAGERPVSTAVAAPAPATPVSQLARTLDALFTDPRFTQALWAVDIRSLTTGETLYARNADKLMIPGSNQKLLSTSVAADRLGWDYQFTTRLVSTGPISSDGTLEGSLIVVGDGDPTINPRDPARWRIFDDWAAMLADRGVRVIRDHLIGDDNLVAEPGLGDGWSWDDLVYGYGTPAAALQYNENQVELTVGPGLAPRARAVIVTSPPGSGLDIESHVETAPAGAETTIAVARAPGSRVLNVDGQIALDAKPVTQTVAAYNPTDFYVRALGEALRRHGIFVGGSIADIDELEHPPNTDKGRTLIVDRSPPLATIVDTTLKWSRNGYAETLLTALSPTRPATPAQGLTVLRTTLDDWGIDEGDYLARDGSGLSRYDYVTARMLVALLSHVWADPQHREAFRDSLPEAGTSGTLNNRMKGTAAEGRVWAKTGTLSNVRALSGYVLTADDEPLAFSILANHYRAPNTDIDAVADRAVVALTELRRRRE